MDPREILVTGGTGVLGRWVVEREGARICPDWVYGRVLWEEFLQYTPQRIDEYRRERIS